MPGVVVTTAPRGGRSAPLVAPSGTWFVVGITERGDTVNPVELRGPADYQRLLGDPTAYDTLSDQIATFFREGGARVMVSRAVGPAAAVGTRTIADGTAVPSLRIDAASPGGWSNRITTQIRAGNDPNTFRLSVFLDGALAEDYQNLTSPAQAAQVLQNSVYVRGTDLGSVTVAPGNNPAVDLAPVAFTTQGLDDRANVTDAVRVAALARFGVGLGDGAVSIPGSYSATVRAGILAHCVANNRVGILADARGATAATLEAAAGGFSATLGAEYLGLYAPWVTIPSGSGSTKAISPEGFVAACRNRAHEQDGPWRVAAGDIAQAQFVVGIDAPFDDATADMLDALRVNVIRNVNGVPEVYGGRSLSSDETDYYWLKNRSLLNYVAVQGKAALAPEVFHTIDSRGHLLSRLSAIMVGLLEPIRAAGGLYERYGSDGSTLIDPGYSVNVGPSVNPVTSLQNQRAAVQVALRPSPAASLIQLTIIEVGLTAAV
jgi:hypothetical protein